MTKDSGVAQPHNFLKIAEKRNYKRYCMNSGVVNKRKKQAEPYNLKLKNTVDRI